MIPTLWQTAYESTGLALQADRYAVPHGNDAGEESRAFKYQPIVLEYAVGVFIRLAFHNLTLPEYVVRDQKASASEARTSFFKNLRIVGFIDIIKDDVELSIQTLQNFQGVALMKSGPRRDLSSLKPVSGQGKISLLDFGEEDFS